MNKGIYINNSDINLVLSISENKAHFLIKSFIVKKKKMKKESRTEYLNKEEINEMIESALRRHNRRSTIISSVLGWILIGGYSFGLFQAVQNV